MVKLEDWLVFTMVTSDCGLWSVVVDGLPSVHVVQPPEMQGNVES